MPLLLLILAISLQYNCTFKTNDGDTIDLSFLKRASYPDYVFSSSNSRYSINFCQTLFMPCNGTYQGLIAKFARCTYTQ